jgi:alpha-ketoglutarate-dependent taurine dioxygenase
MRLAANDVVGAIITDVDVTALDAAGFAAIDSALLNHQMLAIRDQHLTPESFIAFARRFGPIDLHVLDRYWMPGHPEIYDRDRHRRLVWRTSVRGEVPMPGGGILAAAQASH